MVHLMVLLRFWVQLLRGFLSLAAGVAVHLVRGAFLAGVHMLPG